MVEENFLTENDEYLFLIQEGKETALGMYTITLLQGYIVYKWGMYRTTGKYNK